MDPASLYLDPDKVGVLSKIYQLNIQDPVRMSEYS